MLIRRDARLLKGLLQGTVCSLSKRQHTLSRSSAKVEYRGVANVVSETA
ncbi:hypothetical protein Tco_0323035, partial [Tanacetum coccineum]